MNIFQQVPAMVCMGKRSRIGGEVNNNMEAFDTHRDRNTDSMCEAGFGLHDVFGGAWPLQCCCVPAYRRYLVCKF